MAGVARAQDGDGAGDPPRPPPCGLPGSFKSASRPIKKRGISQSLETTWRSCGEKPLPIQFDWKYETLQPVEHNAKLFTRLMVDQVRFNVVPCYRSWDDVSEELRGQILTVIEKYFNVRGGRKEDEYIAIIDGLDRLAGDRYRAYIKDANKYFKDNGPSCRPYGQLSIEDWQRCLDLFMDPKFVVNRANARYPSIQGSRNVFAARYFEDTQPDPSSCASVDELGVVKEVLGKRRRKHLLEVGRIPKVSGKCPSVESTAASSHAPQCDPQRNTQILESSTSGDPRFAIWEAKIAQLHKAIMRLAAATGLPPEDEANVVVDNVAKRSGGS